MSDLIRSFRITQPTYRKGETLMDGTTNPFRLLPGAKKLPGLNDEPPDVPLPTIEGVPPVPGYTPKPERKRHTT